MGGSSSMRKFRGSYISSLLAQAALFAAREHIHGSELLLARELERFCAARAVCMDTFLSNQACVDRVAVAGYEIHLLRQVGGLRPTPFADHASVRPPR